MGAKIKPAFKSDFPLVSEGWHLFRVIEPKVEVIAPENRKEKDGMTNDKNFIVRSAVEGGEEEGMEVMDFFPNYSKKEFGLSRLAGLMIKTEALPPADEIDVDVMRTDKFESKFKMSLPKRLFGGRIKHTPSRDDKERIMQNIVEYATVKEFNEKSAEAAQKGEEKASGKGKTKKTSPETKEEAKEPEKDPWAT
jgi:hypothetical protein